MTAKAIVLLILLGAMASGVAAQSVVSGQLLKSNGKPRQYTEIELVPVSAKTAFDDPRLNTISDSAGRFKFTDVPRGKYTLSINFDERPSDLSPFDTFFYPATANRDEATVLELSPGSKSERLVFKLPPPLVQQKISGKVVHRDGTPVVGALLALRDLKVDRGRSFVANSTNEAGEFSLQAFAGRRYQVGVMLFREPLSRTLQILDFLGAAESEPFLLDKAPVVLSMTLQPDPDVERLRERYLGGLLTVRYLAGE